MAAAPSKVILEPKKIKSVTVSIVSPSKCHEVMGWNAMILVFWMLSFKPKSFSLSYFIFIKRLFNSSSLSAIRVVSVKVAQSYLTLCDPMDYTVYRIFQTRILEWVAFPFSRGYSQPRDWTQSSAYLRLLTIHGYTITPKEEWKQTHFPKERRCHSPAFSFEEEFNFFLI